MAQPNNRPDPKTIPINELAKFDMFAPSPGMEKKNARLTFGIRDGNPRVTVFLNNPEFQKGAGILNAGFYPREWFTVMDSVIQMLEEGKPGSKIELMVSMDQRMEDGSRGQKVLQSTLMIGIDGKGMACIGVKAEGKPVPVFRFEFSDYVGVMINGQQAEPDVLSRMMALSTFRRLADIYSSLTGYFKPPYQGRNDAAAPASGGSSRPAPTGSFDFDDIPQ